MKQNKLSIKTKRLKLQPLSDEEIQKLIDDSGDKDIALAYSQMLAGCVKTAEIWKM